MPNNAEINPLLISLLIGEELVNIPEKPTLSMLPGKYVKLINKQKSKIAPIYPENKKHLICGSCGKKGKYDLGHIVFNIKQWQENKKVNSKINSGYEGEREDITQYLQTTGYYRCKNCNSAGNWQVADALLTFEVLTGLLIGQKGRKIGISTGKITLFDGSNPRSGSDAEDIFLNRILENGQDAYLWNRLGNTYRTGGRPELAAAALEQSIGIDSTQMESHFNLAELLMDIVEWEYSAYHYRMMLIHARNYQKLDAIAMREMLAIGLRNLSVMYFESDQRIQFLPTKEELLMVHKGSDEVATTTETPNLKMLDLDLSPDDLNTYFPLAEMYMGERKKEIPKRKRTLDKVKSILS